MTVVRALRRLVPDQAARRTILALGRRDLRRYFNSPTGYVFITLFILLSTTAAFWQPRFFLNSLATLDQLNGVFPYLLLFFVPALTMSLWSEERKEGTDELLLTLPAHEASVVLGKFAAAAGIYSAALAVSLSHVVVLAWLGQPDLGLMAANYLGFWLMGLALIPIGMLASMLTANATIAFIAGALLCAVPVALGEAAGTVSPDLGRQLGRLTVFAAFGEFSRGIVSAAGLLYFLSLAAAVLFANVLCLQQRLWRRVGREMPPVAHVTARPLALAIALGCLVVLAGRAGLRLDLTAERLSTLSAETQGIIDALPADRHVFIQAFVSDDVPPTLVQTRDNLVGVLQEVAARAGSRVTLMLQDTRPYSAAAALARNRFNILPRRVSDSSTGEETEDVYLGVAITSGTQEQVIPFFEPGLVPEYETVRAIQVVSQGARKRLGVIDTDVMMLGGVDFRTSEPRPTWAAIQELRKQYAVVEVTPATASEAEVDVMLVVLPSRMTQTDLDLAMEPTRRGIPTLLLIDPLPAINVNLAPGADLATEVDPYRPQATTRLIYGNIRVALERLGINWVPALVAWDGFNPHPDLAELPRETVFVSPGNGNSNAINRTSPATAGLREVLLLYPGYIVPSSTPGLSLEPLLQTGRVSGSASFFDLVRPTPAGLTLNPEPEREPDGRQYILAAHATSQAPVSDAPGARPLNVIAVADIDFISDAVFSLRAGAGGSARFDNISFFLNAIDLLAGERAYIALRSRQPRYRTLERLEAQTRAFMERRTQQEQQAQVEARTALEDARARLTQRTKALDARTDLDPVALQILTRNVQETETRRLRILESNIAQARDVKVTASREAMETAVRRIRTRIRALALVLPPAPVLALGIWVFLRRRRRERAGAEAMGRFRVPA